MQLALSSELAQTLVASVELADERVGATERAHIERLDAMRAECSNKLSSLQVGTVRGTAVTAGNVRGTRCSASTGCAGGRKL